MQFSLAIATLLSAATVCQVAAQTVYDIPNADDCNGYVFAKQDLSNAAYQALYDLNHGKTQGTDKYPHQYNDYENIDFPDCQAPYYEFPVFKGKSASVPYDLVGCLSWIDTDTRDPKQRTAVDHLVQTESSSAPTTATMPTFAASSPTVS